MIEKLKMQTPNITEQNMEQIAKLFPNVMTETQDKNGEVQKAIDFDLLKPEFGIRNYSKGNKSSLLRLRAGFFSWYE